MAAHLQRCPRGLVAEGGEDGGGGDLIEVEGGVEGEGEARFHPMEKVHIEMPEDCKLSDMLVKLLTVYI